MARQGHRRPKWDRSQEQKRRLSKAVLEEVLEEGFGGGWAPGGRHGTAPGWVRAEDIAQPWRLSRGALGTQHLVLAVVTERTVVATHPVPHDFTHATIRLEVTLQGHGVTSHHGWERLDVDRQVACGEKEKGEVRARGDQEGRERGWGGGESGRSQPPGPLLTLQSAGLAAGPECGSSAFPLSEAPWLPWVSPIPQTLPGMNFPVKVGPAGTRRKRLDAFL